MMLIVGLICLAVGMVWWQWLLLALISAWVYWQMSRAVMAVHLSASQTDAPWLISLTKAYLPSFTHAINPLKPKTAASAPRDTQPSWQAAWQGRQRRSVSAGLNSKPLAKPNIATQSAIPNTPITLKPVADTAPIYQGYLNKASYIHLGLAEVVILRFFISIPHGQYLTVVVFDDQCDQAGFRKLAALARLSDGL